VSAQARTTLALLGALAFALAAPLACNGEYRFDERAADAGSGGDLDGAASEPRCTSDATCAPLGLRCDLASGLCVACLESADCTTSARPRCETGRGLCVQCLQTSDCPARETCEASTHLCIDACFDDDDPCPRPGTFCDQNLRLCVECKSDGDCASSSRGRRCSPKTGACAICVTNADCGSEAPACDPRSGKCVVCVTSADCAPGSACTPSGGCAALATAP
jgi:hypothetical protein